MKKLFLIVAIGVGLFGTSSWALFSTTSKTTNKITTTSIDLKLSVMSKDENDNLNPIDYDIINVLPGDVISHEPTVTNVGEVAMYTRINLKSMILDDKEEEQNSKLAFNIDSNYWKLDPDGWYRYTEILQPQETSRPLFTNIEIPSTLGNEIIGANACVKLQAQAVQSKYNEYEKSVLEVKGWPSSSISTSNKGGTN